LTPSVSNSVHQHLSSPLSTHLLRPEGKSPDLHVAKTKPSYTSASRRGGQWTLLILVICSILTFSEFRAWWIGAETQHFSVERGVSHELQINLDIVVAMQCKDLHVNVQDAAGDRILAGDLLTRHDTNWQLWTDKLNKRRRRDKQAYQRLHEPSADRMRAEEEDQHVGHVLGHMREGGKKFPETPKLRKRENPDSCRIFGSLEGNKVQGDFHITARGHGYIEFGYQQHLDHTSACTLPFALPSFHSGD
jgi:endoplasmic reticulum-Golgi intermediate compartment protein 2